MHFPPAIASIARGAGHLIGNINFNRIRMDEADGCRHVLKQRRWYAPVLTVAGNLYIRVFRLRIRILSDAAWLRRERALYRMLYGLEVAVLPGGWLEMPWLGRSLPTCLTCPHTARADKLRVLSLAARELHRLHSINVTDGGRARRFSHGDAGARNAAYDPAQARVCWFDFEIMHAADVPDRWRHADDLRAFLFSALGCLPDALRGEAVRTVREAYPEAAVRRCLRERIASGALDTDTYHLAQMQLSASAHRQIAEHIMRHLEANGHG